ncbi:MAG: NAD(P)/FAD-dependent oxidoreductase [Lachnospiraceae bacterium]
MRKELPVLIIADYDSGKNRRCRFWWIVINERIAGADFGVNRKRITMLLIHQLKIAIPQNTEEANNFLSHEETEIKKIVSDFLPISEKEIASLEIKKRSLDARKKPFLFWVYQVAITLVSKKKEKTCAKIKNVQYWTPEVYHFPMEHPLREISEGDRPIVVGSGPAGLFCGYFLAMYGFRPIILERGYAMEKRQEELEHFITTGVLNPDCNVLFGEGGAGTFSDGKLQTGVKDRYGRITQILEIFVRHGAPKEILYVNKPHIGTDILSVVVKNMRTQMSIWGAEFHFATTFLSPIVKNGHICGARVQKENQDAEEWKTSCLVLAPGHSARDTFYHLYEDGVPMEAKPFAVGFRVTHPQEWVNRLQYGDGDIAKVIGAGDYKVTCQLNNRNVYSFCMCPGGYVINSSSEPGLLAINGMSNHKRDSGTANSAIVMSVDARDYGEGVFAGLEFQRKIEKNAFDAAHGAIPYMQFSAFESNEETDGDSTDKIMPPETKGSYALADIRHILPEEMNRDFVQAMHYFGEILPGFDAPEVFLAAVESRTSSPIKILRDENHETIFKGLYPCGEGAGYAGGITSAALDGIKTAEKIAQKFLPGSLKSCGNTGNEI